MRAMFLTASFLMAGSAAILAYGLGCGSSSTGSALRCGLNEACVDSGAAHVDSSAAVETGSGSDSSPANPDGGTQDGGSCTFAGYVIGLINNDTTPTATPTQNLGDMCTDDHNQADFKTLFP